MSNAELVNRVDGLMCRRADMLSVAELQDLRDAMLDTRLGGK